MAAEVAGYYRTHPDIVLPSSRYWYQEPVADTIVAGSYGVTRDQAFGDNLVSTHGTGTGTDLQFGCLKEDAMKEWRLAQGLMRFQAQGYDTHTLGEEFWAPLGKALRNPQVCLDGPAKEVAGI